MMALSARTSTGARPLFTRRNEVGFSFDLTGSRADVIDWLDGLDVEKDLMGDPLGHETRLFFAHFLHTAGDPGPGQQYRVKAEGHSGRDHDRHILSLKMEAGVEPVNASMAGPVLADAGSGSDGLAAP